MNAGKILVVDDEYEFILNVREFFKSYDIVCVSDPKEALIKINKDYFDIIAVDYKLPEMTGIDLLIKAKKNRSYRFGILFTAYTEKIVLENVINNNLISYFLEKPFRLTELKIIIDNFLVECRKQEEEEERIKTIQIKNENLSNQIRSACKNVIGLKNGLKNVFDKIITVSQYEIPILLLGETGVGKEVIANLIHFMSPRQDSNIIKINCAEISSNLLESELFGYARGAFTGANTNKPGLIELADKGTLFLDEICELEMNLQAKLLRVLQEKEVRRIGSTKNTKIDFRLITATNKNIENCINEGSFREDLYYRINRFPIKIPPLRNRKDDIEELTRFFLKKISMELNIPIMNIDPGAIQILKEYSWPGNIRELENVLFQAILSSHYIGIIQKKDLDCLFIEEKAEPEIELPKSIGINIEKILFSDNLSLKKRTKFIEKIIIKSQIKKTGTQTRAAENLQIGLSTLLRKLNK
ncbi:MAG: sigma-54-dependent Fis family transcriptional regulator [Spirochaetales bacterium]|nr:sigma-54-dependent Fis family transcriptional regulator [Spirochaetales bacterium]